jgi:NAD(P)-dependent dehydrogenase (short-subunit alcohol dehydrogenase family)
MSENSGKRICLLTGASGELGETFCRMFAAQYDIAAVFRNNLPKVTSQLQWFADPLMPNATLPENQSTVFAIKADLREEADLHRIVEVTLARFGRIDLLVNAAAYSFWAPILDGGRLQRSFHHQLNLNLFVPLQLSTLVAEKFWNNRELENRYYNRSVVNLSSTAGSYIYPDRGQSVYSASKAALNYLTLHMAQEFGALGVRANALAPTSFPRLIRTEYAADGIRRLSESSVNGKILVLNVDGEQWL